MAKTRLPKKIKKRNGRVVAFNVGKISHAIQRAAEETRQDKNKARRIAERVTGDILGRLSKEGASKIPTVETIQNIIETTLMSKGYHQVAKSYIIYRRERSEIRHTKSALAVTDDLKLPINALTVLKERYLLKDENQNIIETPRELFRRVAAHCARPEGNFKSPFTPDQVEEKFYQMMCSFECIPNSPTLMNAGASLGQLSACFVLPVEDSMEGIFESLKNMAKIHQTGGGTGFNFSRLRPKGDLVSSTQGEASGPVSFMSIFDRATDVIVQGGRRRGANMGILRCDHPDVVEFIESKLESNRFPNFNLSVGITDNFMKAAKKNRTFGLINPRTNKETKTVHAKALFDLIVNAAWRSGDPGLLFLDEMNRRNPTPRVGQLEASNPCGELPLLSYESCNLASLNLGKMVTGDSPDWGKLRDRIQWGIRLLDNVIDINQFPLPQIKAITRANRKIGLGIMGFADMLIKLGIPYHSRHAIRFAERLMNFIHRESLCASAELAKERGVFPNFKQSIYAKKNIQIRNATVNTIAPTGTISIIAGCSSGIEPLFAIAFVRHVLSGNQLFETHLLFEGVAKKRGFYRKEMLHDVARQGSLQSIRGIPRDVKKLFATAHEIPPAHHLLMQAAFQKYTDNAVSKTINLPGDATVSDVKKIYFKAHHLRCKGITVYRYGCKKDQVLSFGHGEETPSAKKTGVIHAASDYSGGCAHRSCSF